MAKLYFKYGAMNSGKTIEVLRTCYNYKERGLNVILIKPKVDLKGSNKVVSRIGLEREVDYLISDKENIYDMFIDENIDVIIADEAQFFTREQINELWSLTKKKDIDILCYGLRCDFLMNGFPGSTRLLEIADSIDEIKTICACGKKATINMRYVNGVPSFEGEQVSIDGFNNVTYDSVCGECYINQREKEKK
jgi:thymidine kinase